MARGFPASGALVRSMTPRQRLAALVVEHGLDADAAPSALTALLRALADKEAPTSIHRAGQSVDVHVADSLAALGVPGLREAERVADLGAGAGLPGLPLAVAIPNAHFALIEGNARKCIFIRRTAGEMALTNATVVQSRAEEWREGLGTHQFVCARAVAALPVLLEYAAPLLGLGGMLIAWKGEVPESEATAATAAAALLNCEPAGVLPVTPFPGSVRRTLHLFRKLAETPLGYPRRPGMASKRPLTATNLQQHTRSS